ncbi:MAG: hypothetical protein IIW81_02415 [Oscillospiraceae bacterium]|nr:hypothetical protein [Oscillospiraceae bacterium]
MRGSVGIVSKKLGKLPQRLFLGGKLNEKAFCYASAYGVPYLKSIVIRDLMLNSLIADMEVVPATAE